MMRTAEGSRSSPARSGATLHRALLASLAGLLPALFGCGGGDGATPIDAPLPPPWWQPKVGEAKNWDIQLAAPIDVSAPRAMYDLDLWDLVPSPTTIDYGDGKPVTVPAGKLAGKLAELHALTPRTTVICHVEVGLFEHARPDAIKFPGYNVDPTKIPDNPEDPAPGTVTGVPSADSVIGWSIGRADLRLLDAREATRSRWTSIVWKRFDLAKQIGCDGIEPGHADVVQYESGFAAAGPDSFSLYAEIAKQGHDRELSIGMKNGTLSGQIDMMADKFDWMMIERCGEYSECDKARPFINLGKPVFAIDYNVDQLGAAQSKLGVCNQQDLAMIVDGLYKDEALTSAVREPCVP